MINFGVQVPTLLSTVTDRCISHKSEGYNEQNPFSTSGQHGGDLVHSQQHDAVGRERAKQARCEALEEARDSSFCIQLL